ncbi:Rv2578c family radical SAM protein [Blastococcus sp. HT6-30]|uniref:Rv2578c family radical SAM protein n=1 Tax=Blastococcus sp. HT6-30 TaxID=3144843 RepID=UPI00321BD05F
MRWDAQRLDLEETGALPGMPSIRGLLRSVQVPEFPGLTFHEVRSKSALNRVPGESAMPFPWTINPYRGCSHSCVYCFARRTHEWLELDTGRDFDSQVVVKTNLVEVLQRELARPSWQREHVALGTNTDPYQRAEGRYRLMPGVIGALARSGTPFSVLTKGTLLRRDVPLLAAAARDVPLGLGVSLAIWDDDLHAGLEPGVPTPRARLDLVRALAEAGLPCGVFLAPVLPGLTDTVEHLDTALGAIAAAGAAGVTVIPLHLRPGAREWFMAWLAARIRSWSRATSSSTPGARTSRPSTAPGWHGGWRPCSCATGSTAGPAAQHAGSTRRSPTACPWTRPPASPPGPSPPVGRPAPCPRRPAGEPRRPGRPSS